MKYNPYKSKAQLIAMCDYHEGKVELTNYSSYYSKSDFKPLFK